MRKLIALAAAAALLVSPALAAPVYVPGQQGAVGPNVAATNSDGATVRVIQPSVTLNDATGAAVGTSGNPLYTAAAATPGTQDVNVAKVNGATVATGHGVASGAQRVELPSDGTGVVGLNAGSNIVGKVGIDQTTPGTTNGVVATGNVASGASDSGNPVKVGCLFSTSTIVLTTGQRGDCRGAEDGAQVVSPYANGNGRWQFAGASGGIVNTTTAVTMRTAAGANLRNFLTSCQVDHDALGGTTELVIRDGASSTVIWRKKLQTTAVEGESFQFPSPIRGSINTLMEVATLTAVTGGVYVNCQGYVAP